MSTIKNRNSVPSIVIVWRDPVNQHAIEWRPALHPFDFWVNQIWVYCDANGRERPTELSLDELACEQFPHWVCGGTKTTTGRSIVTKVQRSGGCRGCGGGRK